MSVVLSIFICNIAVFRGLVEDQQVIQVHHSLPTITSIYPPNI